MMDFNTSSSLGARLESLIDQGLEQRRAGERPRSYLGASRLGVSCERALQYEFAHAQVDPGREHSGRLLRIFERGHLMEEAMIDWLRAAGFDLRTAKPSGEQYGFSALQGRLQGHIDGVIVGGPEGYAYPALWENKCLGSRSWRDLQKRQLAASKPVYHAQVVLYQAYLSLHENPAVFTAVNADTMESSATWCGCAPTATSGSRSGGGLPAIATLLHVGGIGPSSWLPTSSAGLAPRLDRCAWLRLNNSY